MRGFAAVGCAVMVTLPQTAEAVQAAGIESCKDLFVAQLLRTGAYSSHPCVGLGGQPRLRDLVYVPAGLWQATVRGFRILQSETQRDLTAPEVGHVAMVRRIERLRLGPHSLRSARWSQLLILQLRNWGRWSASRGWGCQVRL